LRWTLQNAEGNRPFWCAGTRQSALTLGLTLALILAARPAGSADEKHLAIYAASATYSLPVTDHDGREYIGLLELLEPLGNVSAKTEGLRWKLRFKDVDAEFIQGKDRAKIRGHEVVLFRPFVLENGRGFVPLAALSSLLPRLVGGPIYFTEPSRRLFIGSVATHFTADLSRSNPTRLILNFSAPVNPTIATEPGRLRMTFRRDPVVSPVPILKFDDPVIPSANYSEANGTAELEINSTAPVMASFSNENKTITITAIPQAASATPTPTAPLSPPAGSPAAAQPSTLPAPGAAPIPVPRHYVVVLDASHGGDDHGVTLTPTLLEKDVTLAIARRLRQELETRGVSALVIRDSDANLTADQRAIFTNTARPMIYVAIHAASDGHGVRLYTSLLPTGGQNNGPFTNWDVAQSSFLESSQNVASAVAAELRRKQIPNRTLLAPLRPLNNVATAAIALEIAPVGTNIGDLASPPFQQSLAAILADGIVSARSRLEAAR
jgi:N-acetylmuramoyl-L-alanine amidase